MGALTACLLLPASPALATDAAEAPAPAAASSQAPAPGAGVLTKAPELTKFVEAEYPAEAAAQGLTAEVHLTVTLDADGSVADVQVAQGAGHGFDEAAVAAVRQFRFTPAEVDGVPAAVQLAYVYRFVLHPSVPEAPAGDDAAQSPRTPRAILTGQLLSRGSRRRIEGATVRCGDAADAPEAVSDAEGRFRLEVEPGECHVRVSSADHQLFQGTEVLKPGETTEVNLYLVPQGNPFETVVRGARAKKEVVRRTLSRQEAAKTPGTMGDPIRVIQTLPGVARAPFISGELLVRGSNPGQTATMMDGVRIPILFHLLGGPSVVNAEFLDQLDFFPGGYGSQYGRAVGGLVDVSTRKGAADTLHGSVKVDVLDAGFFVEAPLGDGVSVSAAARRSYIDTLLPTFLPRETDEGTRLIVPRYWDWQVRLDWGAPRGEQPQPGGRSTYYVMGFGSDDTLKVVTTGDVSDRDISLNFNTRFTRLKGDWTYRNGGFTSVFTPYAGYDAAHQEFGSFRTDADVYTLGARELLSLELGSALTLRTGFDLLFEHAKATAEAPSLGGIYYVPFPGSAPEAERVHEQVNINGFEGAVFLESDLKLGRFTFTPGVRANWQRTRFTRNLALDPRLWIRYQLAEESALKGSLGLYSQPGDTFWLLEAPWGNPELDYQRAFQASLGWEQRLTTALTLDVTGFFNRRYRNVVQPGPVVVAEDGSVSQTRFTNTGIGRAYGLELLLKHEPLGRFSGWLSYTLSRALDGRTDDPQGGSFFDEVLTDGYDLSPYDQTHILTLVASYKLPRGWELGARFRYTSGRPKTPLQHPYDRYSSDSNSYARLDGLRLSDRSSPFQQLDVRVDKSWVFNRWTLTAYMDVQNLYFARNVEAVFNDYRYREEVEVPGIPFLPVVGVKGSF